MEKTDALSDEQVDFLIEHLDDLLDQNSEANTRLK